MTYLEDSSARQDYNALYPTTERGASGIAADDDKTAAPLADQQFWVATDAGPRKLLFSASTPIDFSTPIPGIHHVVEVQHDVLRNSTACLDRAMAAYRPDVERGETIVVAGQFNTAVDPIDSQTLAFPRGGWWCAEPSERPMPPISSFEAVDQYRLALAAIFPSLRTWTMHLNSAGARMGYCQAAFSESLDGLEARGVEVMVEPTSAGSVPYLHPVRPVLRNPADPVHQWRIEWRMIGSRSEENRWPYGMGDRAPYAARYVQKHGLDRAMANVIRRIHPGVGMRASDPGAADVPVATVRVDPQSGQVEGIGPRVQGATLLERSVAYQAYLAHYAASRGIEPPAPLRLLQGCGHSGADAIRVMRDYDLGAEDAVRLYSARNAGGHPDPLLFRIFRGVTPRQPSGRRDLALGGQGRASTRGPAAPWFAGITGPGGGAGRNSEVAR